jgi:hypothetical protein
MILGHLNTYYLQQIQRGTLLSAQSSFGIGELHKVDLISNVGTSTTLYLYVAGYNIRADSKSFNQIIKILSYRDIYNSLGK